MSKITVLDMELALADFYNIRQNAIVTNVYWGLGFNHELDIAVLSKSGYLTEVELKISRSDLKADKKKRKWKVPYPEKIKSIYFCVPNELEEAALELIPEFAGLYVCFRKGNQPRNKCKIKKVRSSKVMKDHRKLTEKEVSKFYQLGMMRVWNLKKNIGKLIENVRILKESIKN